MEQRPTRVPARDGKGSREKTVSSQDAPGRFGDLLLGGRSIGAVLPALRSSPDSREWEGLADVEPRQNGSSAFSVR